MTPHDFLNLLWRDKPEEQYVLLWTYPERRSHWFQDVNQAGEFAAAAGRTHDVYVGVGLSAADYGPSRRCTSDEVSGLAGIGSDLDLKSEAHPNKALPTSLSDALTILPPAMAPSILVSTGNGVHPWWLFKEPWIFDAPEECKQAARVLARWHELLKRNAAAHGWVYDKLADLARILRIPGTKNLKDLANPKDVTVLATSDRRYNLSEIEEFLDAAGIPDVLAQQEAARLRGTDKPLVLNLNARIEQEKLDRYMVEDPRFRNTWDRRRHDLKDQSQSGYDLALACFGVDAGLSEQQIVDLIIHHRAIHGQKQRTRVDYFERTIAKAAKGAGDPVDAGPQAQPAAPAEPGPAQTAPQATDTAASPTTDAPTMAAVAPPGAPVAPAPPSTSIAARNGDPAAKDALCAALAVRFQTPFKQFVKYDSAEPRYQIKLAGGRAIEFACFEKFTSQQAVRSAIGKVTDILIPKFKPKDWEGPNGIAQMMLDACYIDEPTEEEESIGEARAYVDSYLAETRFIRSIEDERSHDQKHPFVMADGRLAISTLDFRDYMNRKPGQHITPQKAGAMLAALGGKKCRIGGRKHQQSRRVLPLADFDPREIHPEEFTDGLAASAD